MGIFSLFGKKDDRQGKAGDRDNSRTRRQGSRQTDAVQSSTRPPSSKRSAKAALETALKIDAIESEMSSEFVNLPTQPLTTPPRKEAAAPAKKVVKPAPSRRAAEVPPRPPAPNPSTLPSVSSTSLLLHGDSTVDDLASPSSDAESVIEEAAILYANGQPEMVAQILSVAIEASLPEEVSRRAWHMLFDLYQLTARREEFEQLSIAYLNRFETSPPPWHENIAQEATPSEASGTIPIIPFTGKIDAGSNRVIERIRKLAETQRALRLEFTRVREIDATGCALLLGTLKSLEKSGHELVLVGLAELTDKIRAIVEVGRRDSENAWLLLLEVLRLQNREKDFEEASIDYCVTFEVSPPAFAAPQASVTTSAEAASSAPESEGFTLPAVIEGRIDNLVLAIAAYSDEHEPAIIDCSQLTRVDFQAAGRLLSGLAPFCGNGKQLEFHHVNHLIAELFRVIGLQDISRIFPRK